MTRQLVLRVMLVILGAAAALAIYSIFSDSSEAWKLVFTAMTLAIQIGLTSPFLPADAGVRLDLFQRTMIGHFLLGGALVIASIWLSQQPIGRTVGELLFTWVFLGNAAAIVASVALRHRRGDERALALAENIAIIGSLAAFLIAVAVLVLPVAAGPEHAMPLGFIVLAGTVMAAMSSFGLRGASTNRFMPASPATANDRAIAWTGLGASAGWTMLAALEWTGSMRTSARMVSAAGVTSDLWFASIACASVAVPCGIACVLGLVRVAGPLRWVGRLAIVSAACLGGLNAWLAVESIFRSYAWNDELLVRINGALVVASVVTLIAALVIVRMQRGRPIAAQPIEHLDWTCPRCAVKSHIAPGAHGCTTCGLFVSIAIRDDRCPKCGYDLRAQPHDAAHCPECGRARQCTGFAAGTA
jgi:hypothetical protein